MSNSEEHLYEFGEFRLNTAERLLLRDGKPIQLTPKVFDTLVVLVRNSGHLLEKDRLMQEIWPNTNVEEVNLSVNISALRKALGESEDGPRFIDTVPKRGYRFVADVRSLDVHVEDQPIQRSVSAQVDGAVSRKISPYKILAAVSLIVGLLTIVGAGSRLYKYLGAQSSARSNSTFETMTISRLTGSGKARDAAISPDGKYVAYVLVDGGKQSVWVRQVATASNVQIVEPGASPIGGITFSNDGNYLYFLGGDSPLELGVLYRMPVLGGARQKLLADIDSPITISPDGKRLAFLRGYPASAEDALMVANSDGTAERSIAIRKHPDFFFKPGVAPVWSPDGKIVACAGGTSGPDGYYMTVLGVNLEDAQVKPLTPLRWWAVGRIVWSPDGQGLIFAIKEQESSPSQLWYLSYPGGELHRVTNDLSNYNTLSLTADGKALIAVKSDLLSQIWIGPGDSPGRVAPIQSNSFDGIEGMAWTPDGRLVYSSHISGHTDLWIMNPDGTNQKQLTVDAGNNRWPVVTADGRYIVFMSDRSGTSDIWRMNDDGSGSKELTNRGSEWYPDCSPDSQWVVYRSGFGKDRLEKVSIDGGEAVTLIDSAASKPTISPDGKQVACAWFGDPTRIKLAIYPFAGGQPIKLLDWVSFNTRWTPDGHSLAYIDKQNLNLESQPIDGGPPKQLTNFDSDRIFSFAWSRDGKHLALVRGSVTSDVVLISGFR